MPPLTAAPPAGYTPLMRARLEQLLAKYGFVALAIYLGTFVVAMVGFSLAISTGWKPEGATQGAGMLGLAYVATQLIKPLRVGVTLALTPFVGRLWQRIAARRLDRTSSE